MTAAREIVTDQREQFAFHDDIAYLARDQARADPRHGRGDQRVQERAGLDAPVPPPRLRALPQAPDPDLDRRSRQDQLRQHRLLPQAVRARREVVGRRPRPDQGDLRAARHPRGGAQVPGRRRRAVRQRGRLPLGQGRADQARCRVHGHRPGADRVPGDLPQALRHGRAGRGQQVLGAQRGGLVGRLVRLRPQGRRGPAPAAGLLPDQRREHRPVRADADRRRRGRQGPLHRGLHRADLRDRVAPRRGRRGRRAAGLQGPLHDHPELVERRLQPRHQAGARLRELDRRVDRRQHRLAQDRQVPGDLPARRGRHGRHHHASRSPARASTRTPAPRPSTWRRTPARGSSASRSRRTAAGRPIAATSRSRRAPRTPWPASAATP